MDSIFAETSPSSDGVELPSKTMRWHKRRGKLLLWILAITIGVAISREFGVITMDYLTINSSSQINIKSSSDYWEQGQHRLTEKDFNKKITTTTKTSKIGFDFPPDPDSEIDASIKKRLADAKYIDVFQLKSEVSGMYLLPMSKDGHCEFRLVFGAKSPDGKYFKGEITGKMDFDVQGVCSQRKLRELLGDQVGTQIVNAIESNVRD